MLVLRRVGVSYIYKIESICVCSARLFIVNDNRINKCVLPVIEQDALFLSPFTGKSASNLDSEGWGANAPRGCIIWKTVNAIVIPYQNWSQWRSEDPDRIRVRYSGRCSHLYKTAEITQNRAGLAAGAGIILFRHLL